MQSEKLNKLCEDIKSIVQEYKDINCIGISCEECPLASEVVGEDVCSIMHELNLVFERRGAM